MSLGVPVAPAGMNPAVPGIPGMDPTALAGLGMPPGTTMGGLGMTPGLGLGGVSTDATAMMGLGAAAAAPATVAAPPPIATECLLVSNLFDPNKYVSSLLHSFLTLTVLNNHGCLAGRSLFCMLLATLVNSAWPSLHGWRKQYQC